MCFGVTDYYHSVTEAPHSRRLSAAGTQPPLPEEGGEVITFRRGSCRAGIPMPANLPLAAGQQRLSRPTKGPVASNVGKKESALQNSPYVNPTNIPCAFSFRSSSVYSPTICPRR